MAFRLALVLSWFSACGAPAIAETRLALVVSVSGYVSVPALRNPPSDAALIAGALSDLRFACGRERRAGKRLTLA